MSNHSHLNLRPRALAFAPVLLSMMLADCAIVTLREPNSAFDIDADPKTLVWKPKTISVVLPCAEEREYAVKTVQAVYDSTPRDVLKEIVVVDDGSQPKLEDKYLTEDVQKKYGVKVLRNEETIGLIGSKKMGGDAATGDIVVFFDCHVAPEPGWHKSFLSLISENYRRMVVPQITDLDVTTWKQRGGHASGGGLSKCYLTWDADFKWFDSDNHFVPAISGGLLGLSKRWWTETGGYDEGMKGWGGENIDQSLRMWLCGGEIVSSSDSFVAHMWRTADPRTQARYKHVGNSNVNRARAMYAWYGDYTQKLDDFQGMRPRENDAKGLPWYGDISKTLAIKKKLGCRPYSWFLERFKDVYVDTGMVPTEIFKVKDSVTKKCLSYDGQAGTSGSGDGSVSLVDCSKADNRAFWHVANKGGNGLRAWDTDQCMTGLFKTGVCDITGRNAGQHWSLTSTGELGDGTDCVKMSHDGREPELRTCDKVEKAALRRSNPQWSRVGTKVPIERELYTKAKKEYAAVFTELDQRFHHEI